MLFKYGVVLILGQVLQVDLLRQEGRPMAIHSHLSQQFSYDLKTHEERLEIRVT